MPGHRYLDTPPGLTADMVMVLLRRTPDEARRYVAALLDAGDLAIDSSMVEVGECAQWERDDLLCLADLLNLLPDCRQLCRATRQGALSNE